MSDLISRRALLNAINKMDAEYGLSFTRNMGATVIYNAPAVDAVPVVHGRWKLIFRGNYECSVCGCIPYYAGNINTLNYCPHCGAKMDGGDADV